MTSESSLPEFVRDARLQATIEGNLTIHTRPLGHRSPHETWARGQVLGFGGHGVVWLECKVQGDGGPVERAVKGTRMPENQSRSEMAKYVRELEALGKFSQEKARP